MDAKGSAREDSVGSEEHGREILCCLRECLNHPEQTVSKSMKAASITGEAQKAI